MKIIVAFLLIFPIYLLSAQKDVRMDVEYNYTQGLKYYKAKDFQESYRLFSKIYIQKLSDVRFNFYFGRTAYETGQYEVALAAFERVEIQDGSNLRNRLEMARTYFMLRMYEDSENAFRDVLINPNIPKNVRRNIELYLSRVSKIQQKSFTYATAMLDILYDSNLNYGSIGDYDYYDVNLGTINNISDTAMQFFGNVVNIYDIGVKNSFAIKNNFSLYLKDYSEENDYNLLYLSYAPSLLYKETHYTAELALGIDTMILGTQKFLSSIFLMPRLEYAHSNTLRSIIHFKYQAKRFEEEAQYDLDADRFELSYALQNTLNPRSYIQGNILAINEKKIRGDNIYVDFDEVKLNITYLNQFTSDYSFELFAQARERSYQDYSAGFNSIRSDLGGLGNISFTMKLMPKLRVKLKTSYEYVNSNQDRFSYQKHTASIGLVKIF